MSTYEVQCTSDLDKLDRRIETAGCDDLIATSENDAVDIVSHEVSGIDESLSNDYGRGSIDLELNASPLIPTDLLSISLDDQRSEIKIPKKLDTKSKKKVANSRANKRKASISITMLEFVHCLERIVVDVSVKQCDVTSCIVSPYIEALTTTGIASDSHLNTTWSNQKSKLHCAGSSSDIAAEEVSPECIEQDLPTNGFLKQLNSRAKQPIYLSVLNEMLINLEVNNANVLFSREHLKYFLATYQRFVTVDDFANSNCLAVGSKKGANAKKQKPLSRLINGAILVEYSKSPYLFASNLSRCEAADVEAIRFIVGNEITLSQSIYRNIPWKMEDVKYVVDEFDTERVDYVRVPIHNFKRAALLICECVVLLFDGVQFVLPTPSIERDITATAVASARLMQKEHIVLDVLLANKVQVIDIIATNKKEIVLANGYTDRLQQVREIFRNVKTVPIDEAKVYCSYIQKATFSHDAPVYIYNVPNHTLAAVGLQSNTVLLAYQDDNGDLVYRVKSVNSGPAAVAFGVVPLQSTDTSKPDGVMSAITVYQNASTNHSISLADNGSDDTRVTLIGLENESDIRLFTHAIKVELKDGNKLGSLSRNPITNLRKYRPHSNERDSSGVEAVTLEHLTCYMNNPNNFGDLIKAISKSTQFDAIMKYLQVDNADFSGISLGY